MWSNAVYLLHHLRAMVAGDLDGAEQWLARFADQAHHHWWPEGVHGLLTFLLRREQGRLGRVAPALRSLIRLQPETSFWRPGLVALYAELGMLTEAGEEFERLAVGGFAAIPHDGGREMALGFAAEACIALGDHERAGELLGFLSPCAGRLLTAVNQACLGPADRLLALLAATAGQNEEAERRFFQAIEFCRRMPSPLWLAHCLHDAAVHLPNLDRDQAQAMRGEAAELCQRHGLAGLAHKLAETEKTLGT
jgi:tetratricopeptide (TPR) repeat protein